MNSKRGIGRAKIDNSLGFLQKERKKKINKWVVI